MALLFLVIWGTGGQALAQHASAEKPLTLDPIVVTATMAPTPLSRTTAPVTVISREDIASQQAEGVIDLLRQVPGLHIDQAGARGGISSVYLRGSDPNFTVVLLDGVKVNDPTNSRGGSFDFSTLSTDNIERIEIVRGPISAVYGSDALGGVINIITRRGTGIPTGSVAVTAGRFDHYRTLLQANGVLGAMDYAVSGSYLDSGRPVVGNRFLSGAFNANVGIHPTDTVDLRWVLRYANSRRKAFPDDSGGPMFAVLRTAESRDADELTTGLGLHHKLLPWWEYDVQIGLYSRDERLDSPGVAPGLRDPAGIPPNLVDNTFRRTDISLRHLFSVTQGVQLAAGAQVQFEDGTSVGSLLFDNFALPTDFSLARTIWGPFFEVQLSLLPGLSVQAGVRVDVPQRFDTQASPRVGVAYTLEATHTTLRVNWGEGFKLPSFFALSHPLVGNPTLQPETSRSVDAGISQELWGKHVILGMTYFYNAFTNLIDFDAGPPPRLINRSETTTQGVEMALRLQPWANFSTTAHLTYLQTDIQGTTQPLRSRPKWRGGFAVQWYPRPELDINLHTLAVGEVFDSSIPTAARTLDAYARVDLAAAWALHKQWKVFLAIENLFDAGYEEFIGFPAPGISPRAGVRASF